MYSQASAGRRPHAGCGGESWIRRRLGFGGLEIHRNCLQSIQNRLSGSGFKVQGLEPIGTAYIPEPGTAQFRYKRDRWPLASTLIEKVTLTF